MLYKNFPFKCVCKGGECFCEFNQQGIYEEVEAKAENIYVDFWTNIQNKLKETPVDNKVNMHIDRIVEDRQGNVIFQDTKQGHSITLDGALFEGQGIKNLFVKTKN